MSNRRDIAIVLVLFLGSLWSCAERREAPPAGDRPPLGRVSPLGLGQPDPEIMVAEALAAWKRGDRAAFLSRFAFADPETGQYGVPKLDSEQGRADLDDLQALKNALFPLARLDFAWPSFGEPRNVRNNPPTVEVPIEISRDFDSVPEDRRRAILAEVNVALHGRGQPRVDWQQYRAQVEAQPSVTSMRFVHLEGDWRFDGGNWRPARR
ncbi:MAG: hypothetical protein H6807_07430 [Planctomycetes bacterium]|nr:hypothetical protein [Planctomycetota bacterium]